MRKNPAVKLPEEAQTDLPTTPPTGRRMCIVGVGASAGGLQAAKTLVHALPAASGLVFILVQHMDSTPESMMVELGHVSAVPVVLAEEGMIVEADHLYVIPPGNYLSVSGSVLHLRPPQARHGARVPFDFLLQSLAASARARAICVVLSGRGADGTLGLQAIKAAGGLVIVQAPEEAGFNGMPQSAIATGQVDFVLPVEEIAKKIANHRRSFETPRIETTIAPVIALLRDRTGHAALHSLDTAKEDQNAINEEMLSSKEELQSLNEALTALNTQLQETLEHSRTTTDDLQNILYSTNVATLFLDTNLKIRFFTPVIQALFKLIPSDVGRPLTDFHSISSDLHLFEDAAIVLKSTDPIERQVQTQDGLWFSRRILPYRTHSGAVAGIVITFIDITELKIVTAALEESRLAAERANIAKTRFLAAASHDLRQPLQAMLLLNRMLAKIPTGVSTNRLLLKLDETTTAMTGILNTLLDINQIDAGIVKAEMVDFPIGDLLRQVATAFVDLAESRGLKLHFVTSSLRIVTDPRFLEQMLRNFISNALKYTEEGGILIGCRRHGKTVEIQIWDTGLGIPEAELKAIFEEHHQVDNPARELSRGLGLGLSIVQRLGTLMRHKVAVRSIHGKGSVFSIEVPAVEDNAANLSTAVPAFAPSNLSKISARSGRILVIEDDPDIRQLLEMFLTDEGHQVTTARDGHDAIALITPHTNMPDLILSDYNLPNGSNGLEVTKQLRKMIGHAVAVVIITGDITTRTMKDIADADCVQLNKPMRLTDLNNTIQCLLTEALPLPASSLPKQRPEAASGNATIFVIDDDLTICGTMRELLESQGYFVETFTSGETFLASGAKSSNACLLLDANLPGISGFDLLQNLPISLENIQAIMITGQGDVKLAVQAIKCGAFDFIEKPVGHDELLTAVSRALERSRLTEDTNVQHRSAVAKVASLTIRQQQIMQLVLAGEPSKIIAADLGISQRTVENHRASIMQKTGAKSLPALARLAMAANEKAPFKNGALRK